MSVDITFTTPDGWYVPDNTIYQDDGVEIHVLHYTTLDDVELAIYGWYFDPFQAPDPGSTISQMRVENL